MSDGGRGAFMEIARRQAAAAAAEGQHREWSTRWCERCRERTEQCAVYVYSEPHAVFGVVHLWEWWCSCRGRAPVHIEARLPPRAFIDGGAAMRHHKPEGAR